MNLLSQLAIPRRGCTSLKPLLLRHFSNFAGGKKYLAPKHPSVTNVLPPKAKSPLERSYDWMIKTYDDYSAKQRANKKLDPYHDDIEQPDFSEVPPTWWERRTSEERTFIFIVAGMSILAAVHLSDKYYESRNELHPITVLLTSLMSNEVEDRAKRIAKVEAEFDKAAARYYILYGLTRSPTHLTGFLFRIQRTFEMQELGERDFITSLFSKSIFQK